MMEFDLQLFADGEDANSGGEQEAKPFAVFPDEKSFMSRVEREARKHLEAQAKALGFDSIDAMQAAIKAAQAKAEADKTELQKAQEEAAQAKADKEAAIAAANERLIRAEVKLLAGEMGLIDADAALALIDRAGVSVGEKGTVEGAREALDALVAAKPWLKKGEGKKVGEGTNPPGAGGGEVNPWKRDTFNLTMQGKILRENPALAARLKAEAKG